MFHKINGRRNLNKVDREKGLQLFYLPNSPKPTNSPEAQNPSPHQKTHFFAGRFIGVPLHFRTVSPKGSIDKSKITKLFISSIYHPWKPDQCEDFNSLATSLLSQAPKNSINIVGHDLNASVVTHHHPNDSEEINNVIGPFSLDNQNEKGCQAICFLLQMDLRVMSTYFNHDSYTTHISKFTTPHTPLMLDSISVSSNGVKKKSQIAKSAK